MSEKRFQVFISSTFRDLVEERQAVLKAVLELGQMPAGMELFPATDDAAWQLIRDVIDASDYYVLLVGGRYGSVDKEGLSFTEKEYNYAKQREKPIIALLCKAPEDLPRKDTEMDPLAWAKLEAFRRKVEQNHTCVYWDSADALKAQVILGLTTNMKRKPAVGWIRADQMPSKATLADLMNLRQEVIRLESELQRVRTEAPPGTEDLMQGDDDFVCEFSFSVRSLGFEGYLETPTKQSGELRLTWDQIFAAISPVLINEAADQKLRKSLRALLEGEGQQIAKAQSQAEAKPVESVSIKETAVDTCIVQLRALGLIAESNKKRSVTDKGTYWTLTPYGDRTMVQLRALRRGSRARVAVVMGQNGGEEEQRT